MTEHEVMLMKALSAVSHLIEFIDTEESFDLAAAIGALNDPELNKWIEHNSVLLPLRRDDKSLLERLAIGR